MYQIYSNLIFGMGEGTLLAKIAILDFLRIAFTKLSFVFFWVIETLKLIMRFVACLARAILVWNVLVI